MNQPPRAVTDRLAKDGRLIADQPRHVAVSQPPSTGCAAFGCASLTTDSEGHIAMTARPSSTLPASSPRSWCGRPGPDA